MLLIKLIKLVLLVLLLSFIPTKKTVIAATLLLPFQQAFTLNVAGTVRISDILYVSALAGLIIRIPLRKSGYSFKQTIESLTKAALKKLRYNLKHNAGVLYFGYLSLGSLAMGILLRNNIQSGLATLNSYNQSRLLVNVLTPLIALLIFIVGNYAGYGDSEFYQKILEIWAKALIFLSSYVIIQFIVVNLTGTWVTMPGEVLNYNTSFAYGIRRPWGFSIEPGALGNFLFFSMLMVYMFLKKSRLQKITVIISSIAIVLSFSSIAIFAIATLWGLLIISNWKKFKTGYKLFFILAILAVVTIVFTNNTVYDATIGKVFAYNYSKTDRQTNTQILIRMFASYPIFGIGAGNYGALRNLFAQGTLFPIREFYDMPNVFYFGMAAEQGIVGVVIFLLFIRKLWNSGRILKISSLIWLVPLAVLIATASTITFDYMAFGFGLVIGQSEYLKNRDKINIYN